MLISSIFLIALGMVIGALAAYMPIYMGCKRLPNAVDHMISDNEAEALLNEELDQLILTFQQEIPMASTFLKGTLLERLRSKAKSRLMGLFPKIKNRLNAKLSDTILSKVKSEAKNAILMGMLIGLIISTIAVVVYSLIQI